MGGARKNKTKIKKGKIHSGLDDVYDRKFLEATTDGFGFAPMLSTPLKLVEHAFRIYGSDLTAEGYAQPQIYDWLESLDWISLDEWNEARVLYIYQPKPARRNSKFAVIDDIVAQFYQDEICCSLGMRNCIVFNPKDFIKIAGLSSQHMKMSQFELGYELATTKKPANTTPKVEKAEKQQKPKKTYASTAKSAVRKKSTVIGTNSTKIGIEPQKMSLHLKVQKGGDISKITKWLKESKLSKATDIKTTHISNTRNFDSYQLKCTVDFLKMNFWLKEGFWPFGVAAKKWFGKDAVPLDQRKFARKIFVSNVGDISAATVVGHVRSTVYPDVKFKSVSFDSLGEGNGTITLMIEDTGEIMKFKDLGLRASRFPVKVKWFRQPKTKMMAWHVA